jgi:hypothetical protein
MQTTESSVILATFFLLVYNFVDVAHEILNISIGWKQELTSDAVSRFPSIFVPRVYRIVFFQ